MTGGMGLGRAGAFRRRLLALSVHRLREKWAGEGTFTGQ